MITLTSSWKPAKELALANQYHGRDVTLSCNEGISERIARSLTNSGTINYCWFTENTSSQDLSTWVIFSLYKIHLVSEKHFYPSYREQKKTKELFIRVTLYWRNKKQLNFQRCNKVVFLKEWFSIRELISYFLLVYFSCS